MVTSLEEINPVAACEGKSLSEWLRDAAHEKLAAAEERSTLGTIEELDAFFAGCDDRPEEREPEWEVHRTIIERSIMSGASPT